MRRPIDPRNHGLREPIKEITRYEFIHLDQDNSDNYSNKSVKLSTIVDAWNKVLKGHIAQGHRIVEDPVLISGFTIKYKIGWDNESYQEELANYNKQVTKFEEELAVFINTEEELKTLPPSHARVIEIKIEKAKQRLANLEAVRDNKPLPFP